MKSNLSYYFSQKSCKYVLTDKKTCSRIYEYVYIRTSVSGFNETSESSHISQKLEVYGLANIKSAKKRIKVTEIKTARNKAIKSKVKTSIKKVEAAVAEKNTEAAKAALVNAISDINKAASKGIYHKNNAARKVSHLTKAVNSIA